MPYIRIAHAILWLTRAVARSDAEPEQASRARRYNREKERLYIIGIVVSWLAGALFLFSGLSAAIRQQAFQMADRGIRGRSLAIAVYGLLGWLSSLPLGFYGGYVIEHRYGLSNQSRLAWIQDQLKTFFLSLTFEIPIAHAIYAIIRRWPRAWWALVTTMSVPFTVLLAQLAPVLIAPLFNKYEPLRDRALAERLKTFAAQSGIRVADVLQMDMSRQTKKANAFFTGIGRTKRIVLADTLLENFTPEEIETVLAHEIAHQTHRDIWRFIAVGTLFTAATSFLVDRAARLILQRYANRIGTRHLADVATLPLFAWVLSIAGVALSPVQNAYSRRIERRADTYALNLTQSPAAFASAMDRLATLNLADPNPPALVKYVLYSHPPVQDRIERAHSYAQEHGLPAPRTPIVG